MSELIKIGSTGVRVNQNNLGVTGHNIANVDTDGYSRQDAIQATNPSISMGNGHFGQGARTDTVRRIVDEFMVTQLRNDTSLAKEREMMLGYAKQLDNLLSDADSSPGNALNEFFAAMQSLADDPNNMPLRNMVLAQGDALSQRFNLMQERFDDMQTSVNVQLKGTVSEINRISSNIAELNTAIIEAEGSNGLPANDLRDARDEQLRSLSEYVDVSLTKVADGTYSVFIGEGFPLVVNNKNYELSAEPLSSDIQRLGIVFNDVKGDKDVTKLIRGGELGGMLKFRDKLLSDAQNQIGRLALTIGDTFNAQHKLGIDLNNQIGGDFFRDVNELELMEGRVSAYRDNSPSTNIRFSVEITDTKALTDKDYVLKAISGDTFSIVDAEGNPVRFQKNTTPVTYSNTVTLAELNRNDGVSDELKITVDGFDLYLSSDAAKRVAKGDQFLIQPARYAAGQIERDITSPEELAIASPLRFEPHLANTGSGELRSLVAAETFRSNSVDPTFSPNSAAAGDYAFIDQLDGTFKMYQGGSVQSLPQGLSVSYTAINATNDVLTYEVRDPNTNTVLHTGTYTQGVEQDMLPADWGIQFRLGGNPVVGDSFKVNFNTDGFGDNSNALRLTALQGEPTLKGDMSYQDAYAHTTEMVGTTTAEAKITAQSGAAILSQTKNLRDSVSGVNLDEEAANLVRFQQAYNASSQLISTAKQLFDTLLAAVR
ncbi:flagellar hook-associated protein 1 FlgK [Oceanospirillum multiglobuliferum]|uniref:Flagellar hook-associated protein 1 n=1 Tax=Oceanospirillum multiglobuliferum TaxID=64969 RepID=A0A1T4RJD5_9GAMM|nr:flagellar hook-associated protein FlgK [Oceanospirillum multiglobuliferum]OPX54822.1 flagellar hook-associated protein FlgK [Oceanospirillum multiglobuliferum]SKA16120.1 flagellar hook-associated protein 1 FlgK [Oceanospirillum multiglobuliferum]